MGRGYRKSLTKIVVKDTKICDITVTSEFKITETCTLFKCPVLRNLSTKFTF